MTISNPERVLFGSNALDPRKSDKWRTRVEIAQQQMRNIGGPFIFCIFDIAEIPLFPRARITLLGPLFDLDRCRRNPRMRFPSL